MLFRSMEGANGTSINTNSPMYTCEVGMRGEDDIKGKEREKREGREHFVIKFLTKLKNNIKEQTSSDFANDDLLQHKPFLFHSFNV